MFSIVNQLKVKTPDLPFAKVAAKILGPKYALGLVLVSPAECRRLNKTYRHKDYATNVLSFPLSQTEGDIVINLAQAKVEAPKYFHQELDHLLFLFIHGCLHLKGLTHGAIMSKEEEKFFKLFASHVPTNHHRPRYRHELPARRRVRNKQGR